MNNGQSSFEQEVTKNGSDGEWKGLAAVAVIGLAIGCIIGYLIFGRGIFNPTSIGSENESGNGNEIATSTNDNVTTVVAGDNSTAITVNDQGPGNRVRIAAMTLPEGAWVVTFTSTEDRSRPERIIGAQYFNAGTYTDVTAYIAEGIIAGETYFVTFYRDDAVRGSTTPGGHVFDSITDRPIVRSGSWVMDSFQVQSTGSRG